MIHLPSVKGGWSEFVKNVGIGLLPPHQQAPGSREGPQGLGRRHQLSSSKVDASRLSIRHKAVCCGVGVFVGHRRLADVVELGRERTSAKRFLNVGRLPSFERNLPFQFERKSKKLS